MCVERAIAKSKRLFPLDRNLKLRADHWSGGVARVSTRQGLQARSFKLAAAGFNDATGCEMSAEGLRKVTEGWGKKIDESGTRQVKRYLKSKRKQKKSLERKGQSKSKRASQQMAGLCMCEMRGGRRQN